MSDNPWWRHRKKRHRRREPWLNDIFNEFDRIENMMNEMMRQAFQESPDLERSDRDRTKSYVYGFSMTTGPDGKPIIKEYGNLKPKHSHSKAEIKEIKTETEPLIDVLEEPKEIIILAQLPGIQKEDIHLDITETQTTVTIDTKERSIHKKLQLPAIVNPKSAKTSYKNGVLQIKLPKTSITKIPYQE